MSKVFSTIELEEHGLATDKEPNSVGDAPTDKPSTQQDSEIGSDGQSEIGDGNDLEKSAQEETKDVIQSQSTQECIFHEDDYDTDDPIGPTITKKRRNKTFIADESTSEAETTPSSRCEHKEADKSINTSTLKHESDSDRDSDDSVSTNRKRRLINKFESSDGDDQPPGKRRRLSDNSDSSNEKSSSKTASVPTEHKCVADKIRNAQKNDGITPEKKLEFIKFDKPAIIRHIDQCSKCSVWNTNAGRTDIVGSMNCSYNRIKGKKDNAYDSTDWKFNPQIRRESIFEMCQEMKIEPVTPAIDTFASNQNVHDDALLYLTDDSDFFSDRWNCHEFWALVTAWSNPPFNWMLLETVRKYKLRKMCGFICGPNWLEREYGYRNEWWVTGEEMDGHVLTYEIESMNMPDIFFPPGKTHSESCPFNTLILYFDFRDAQ